MGGEKAKDRIKHMGSGGPRGRTGIQEHCGRPQDLKETLAGGGGGVVSQAIFGFSICVAIKVWVGRGKEKPQGKSGAFLGELVLLPPLATVLGKQGGKY